MTDDHTSGGGERPLTDEERATFYREQVKRLHTVDLVRAMLADVVTLAYQKLGLTAETADMRDLGDVRTAIETLRRLVEVLDSEGAADEARTYRSTLAALQLQFAAAAAAAGSETRGEPKPAGRETAAETPATKASAKRTPAKKASSKKTPAKKTQARGTPDKKARPAKKSSPKKGSAPAGS